MIRCPTCGGVYHSLGLARHRTMHYEAAKRKQLFEKKRNEANLQKD